MRITNTMLVNNMMNYIGNNLIKLEKYQNQLATGKKISVPSDDPVVAARSLKLKTDVAEIGQFKRNIDDAKSWLEITETALNDVGAVLHRARELAIQAANGTNTQDDAAKISSEIAQLRKQMVHLANSTHSGRYLFSGFKTDQSFIDETTGQFNMDVGNDENIKFEIGIGDNIDVNVTGGDLFNDATDATAGNTASLIQVFDDYIVALGNNDTTGINTAIEEITEGQNNLLRIKADVGARYNRLELTANRLENDELNFTKLMSLNEDVDMAETIMHLQNEENIYRASLAGGAKIILPSLIDFLR
jgi:flagellar hook-associated protein 3 FlgL